MKITASHMEFLENLILRAKVMGWTSKEQFTKDVDLTWHAMDALAKTQENSDVG